VTVGKLNNVKFIGDYKRDSTVAYDVYVQYVRVMCSCCHSLRR